MKWRFFRLGNMGLWLWRPPCEWRPGWEEHRVPFQPQSLRFQLGHQTRACPLIIQQCAGTSEGAEVCPNPAPPQWVSPQKACQVVDSNLQPLTAACS